MKKSFTEYFSEKYEPKAAGEKRFVAKHKVKVSDYPVDQKGNQDVPFKATQTKMINRHTMHGNNPGEDAAQYEDWDHGFTDEELSLIVDTITEEEFEQLDELSKYTLQAYAVKSAESIKDKKWDMTGDAQKRKSAVKKINNRANGMTLAAMKLAKNSMVVHAKEEAQLDELSKNTLGRYIKTSANTMRHHELERTDAAHELKNRDNDYVADKKAADKYATASHKIKNRWKGISTATNKLTREEALIDERVLTVGSYSNEHGHKLSILRKEDDQKHHLVVHAGKVVDYHHGNPSDLHKKLTKDGFSGSIHEGKTWSNNSRDDDQLRDKGGAKKFSHRQLRRSLNNIRMEQARLDELSASTLGRYVRRSAEDENRRRENGIEVRDQMRKASGMNFGTPFDRKLHSNKHSRAHGRSQAIGKLTGKARIPAGEK